MKDQKNINIKKAFDSVIAIYEGWESAFNAFRNGIFPIKEKKMEKD